MVGKIHLTREEQITFLQGFAAGVMHGESGISAPEHLQRMYRTWGITEDEVRAHNEKFMQAHQEAVFD